MMFTVQLVGRPSIRRMKVGDRVYRVGGDTGEILGFDDLTVLVLWGSSPSHRQYEESVILGKLRPYNNIVHWIMEGR